jgi:hypothetical protein
MKISQPLFSLICFDVKTGVKHEVWIDNPIRQTVNEEKAMFERNVKPDMATFEIVETDKTSTDLYEKNPFDSTLKKEPYSTLILDVGEKDRYMPMQITISAAKEEEKWIDSQMDSISKKMYKRCVEAGTQQFKIVGSLCHRGFVNTLFDREHCSDIDWIRRCTEQIGNAFDPVIISKLKHTSEGGHIYVGGFYTDQVKRFCEYCEIMFGVNKYEVAKYFAKTDPKTIDINCDSLSTKTYNMSIVAAIHAENGDYDQALKYYQMATALLEGKTWQPNYQRSLDKFLKYFKKNGTTILSSNF